MAETPAAPTKTAIKKGSLVKVNRAAYQGSLEATASAGEAPAYLLEGPGEVLATRGDYAQLRFRRPVPDIWLRLDQLEAY
jgi:hypothetical protein